MMIAWPVLKHVRDGLGCLLAVLAVGGSPLFATPVTLTPPQATNLALWLRADAGVTTDINGFVSQWDDQSGTGNHVAQATGSLQPALVTGVTYSQQITDPFSVIRFDGTDDVLIRTTSVSSLPTNLAPGGTVFVVKRLAAGAGTLMAFGNNNNNRFSMGIHSGSPGTINPRLRVNATTGGTTSSSVDPQLGTYYVTTAVWNGPGTAALTAHVLNPNGSLTTDAQGTILSNATFTGSQLYVGALGFGVTTTLNGDIAELLIYNTGLGASDQSTVRTYLGQKYGIIPVPAQMIPGDFDNDGDVDGADFVVWQTNFPKTSGATLADGDADADLDVDGADFAAWQTNFPFTSSPGVAPVPEPQAIWLLVVGGLVGLGRCMRPTLKSAIR